MNTELVEVLLTWALDDFPHFEFVPGFGRQQPPSAVEEVWRGEFDYAYANAPGGFYDLCMHPQAIGRGHRLMMLERLIGRIKNHDGVVFETFFHEAAHVLLHKRQGLILDDFPGKLSPLKDRPMISLVRR